MAIKFVFTAVQAAQRYLQLQEVELRDAAGGLVPVQGADNPGGVSPLSSQTAASLGRAARAASGELATGECGRPGARWRGGCS